MRDMVSIVTLTHNKLDCSRPCLSSWLESSHRPLEIIVVDNGSTDGTAAWLNQFARDAARRDVAVRLRINPSNVGCSTGRNQGLDIAAGAWIAILDNDVALRTRRWIEGLQAAIRVRGAALAGPKLVYPVPPFPIQCAGVGISRSGRVLFRGRGAPREADPFNQPREVQCLISACWLMPRATLDGAGPFDEDFNPVQFEDFDLCYRLRSRGHTVIYEPSVEMYHVESVTTAGTPDIVNAAVVIRHGLLFKKRWRHMFENEDGPPDADTAWKRLPLAADPLPAVLPIVEGETDSERKGPRP